MGLYSLLITHYSLLKTLLFFNSHIFFRSPILDFQFFSEKLFAKSVTRTNYRILYYSPYVAHPRTRVVDTYVDILPPITRAFPSAVRRRGVARQIGGFQLSRVALSASTAHA